LTLIKDLKVIDVNGIMEIKKAKSQRFQAL